MDFLFMNQSGQEICIKQSWANNNAVEKEDDDDALKDDGKRAKSTQPWLSFKSDIDKHALTL